MQTPEQSKIWRAANREKLRRYNQSWRLANLESEIVKESEYRIKTRVRRQSSHAARYADSPDQNRARYHGLTVNQIAEMRLAQKGLCGLCFIELPIGKNTHVDHDHTTGRIRGLLCARCNWHIAVLENRSEEWMTRARLWIGKTS